MIQVSLKFKIMEKEPKNWSDHPAYKEEDLEIKNNEELEEAKEIVGVARNTEEIDNRIRAVATEEQDVKLQRRSEKQRNKEAFVALLENSGIVGEQDSVHQYEEKRLLSDGLPH